MWNKMSFAKGLRVVPAKTVAFGACFLCGLLINVGCANAGCVGQEEVQRIKTRLNAFRYKGEGLVEITAGKAQGLAQETLAKQKARDGLAVSIRVRIKRVIVETVQRTKVYAGREISNTGSEEFEKRAQEYVDMVMGAPDFEEGYVDCSAPGKFVYVMGASNETVARWEEDTETDLKKKLSPVITSLNESLDMMRSKQIGASLTRLLAAKHGVDADFSGMPVGGVFHSGHVYAAYDKKGGGDKSKIIDIPAFVESRLEELLAGIKIRTKDKELVYAANGKLVGSGGPVVRAVFVDSEGKESGGIVGLPLIVRFANLGDGEVKEKAVTGRAEGVDGQVELVVNRVNPGVTKTVIEVVPDAEKLGLAKKDLLLSAALAIPLRKKRTILLSTRFAIAGEEALLPEEYIEDIRDLLGEKNDIEYFSGNAPETAKGLGDLKESAHAEDLFVISLEAESGGLGPANLYTVKLSGSAKMYSLQEEKEAFNVVCPCKKVGERVEEDKAAEESLAKNWPAFLNKISIKLATYAK